MGMFDDLRCSFPLPIPGANELTYQTKDTEAQALNLYEIRVDGTLWHQEYDVKDMSDPKAEGIERFFGCMTRINERWVPERHNGEICFYARTGEEQGWLEFCASFRDGRLVRLDQHITNAESGPSYLPLYRSEAELESVDRGKPIQIVAAQLALDSGELVDVDGLDPISLEGEDPSHLLSVLTASEWEGPLVRHACPAKRDLDSALGSSWLPLVTFRNEVCDTDRHADSSPAVRELLGRLRREVRDWRAAQADVVVFKWCLQLPQR